MKDACWFGGLDLFEKKGRFFAKFKSKEFAVTCLYMLDRPPIRVWGDWYYIRGMED